MSEVYLVHHGIKGQKWGVRRFQNEDGSLTSAGKVRYAKDQVKKASQKAQYTKKDSDYEKVLLLQEKYETLKASEALQDKRLSKHLQNLEKEYIDQGMSEEEAKAATYKRRKTEMIIAATAGITLGAAAAYIGYKAYDEYHGGIIPKGTTMQNISVFADKGVRDAFYFTYKDTDNAFYDYNFSQHLKGSYGQDAKIYKTKMMAESDVKIAPRHEAKKAIEELVKDDPEFGCMFEIMAAKGDTLYYNHKDYLKFKKTGKISDGMYDFFNMRLPFRDPDSISMRDKFYGDLKYKGFNAVIDTNDERGNGFSGSVKKPVIAFGITDQIKVTGRELLNDTDQESARLKYEKNKTKVELQQAYRNKRLKALISDNSLNITSAMVPAASIAVINGILRKQSKQRTSQVKNRVVEEYRKQHPNSRLSDSEIIDRYSGYKEK